MTTTTLAGLFFRLGPRRPRRDWERITTHLEYVEQATLLLWFAGDYAKGFRGHCLEVECERALAAGCAPAEIAFAQWVAEERAMREQPRPAGGVT